MRTNITKSAAAGLRQSYLQWYLKQFLRRVHPDLFQHHPREQLQNSASLQDLLPIVSPEKNKDISLPLSHSSSAAESTKKFAFYYRVKDADQKSNARTSISISSDESKESSVKMQMVEHILPVVLDTQIPSSPTSTDNNSRQDVLKREVKSWEMVQSFIDLCRKVGVPVKAHDQKDISNHLNEAIQNVEIITRTNQQKRAIPQKPVSQVFMEELQNSFSGSSGHTRLSTSILSNKSDILVKSGASFDTISDSHIGKIGGSAPALDAQLMIQSNPLLFKSPELSSLKLNKVIRTWVHWQNEDQHLDKHDEYSSPIHQIDKPKPFRLGSWWRKVPVMVMNSKEEREQTLEATAAGFVGKESRSQLIRGMLVVDQDMSKQDMVEYLEKNLSRIQQEYREMLKGTSPIEASALESAKMDDLDEAESYIARMRAKTQNRHDHQRRNKMWR
ncbi:hypothetical protein FBU30_004851 [Linnemannia zychae]|nr:hypothetical protein FBU30_004851 [Linnemannia zychae]